MFIFEDLRDQGISEEAISKLQGYGIEDEGLKTLLEKMQTQDEDPIFLDDIREEDATYEDSKFIFLYSTNLYRNWTGSIGILSSKKKHTLLI